MSPDRRAYSLKKHSIVLYTSKIVYLVLPSSLPPAARRPRNDKIQRGLVTNTNDPSTSNQMLLDITQ